PTFSRHPLLRLPTLARITGMLWLSLCLGQPVGASEPPPRPATSLQVTPVSHGTLDELLQATVVKGRVDYAALQQRRSALDAYLKALAGVSGARLAQLSRDEQLAFYLNAYNAGVLKAVVDAYPIKSIMDLPNVFKRPMLELTGQTLSLDDLENKIIRPRFQEPRIHFALNCAALSCPPLVARAFTAAQLETQLEQAAQQFIRSPAGLQVDVRAGIVKPSKIFEWFAADFVKVSGVQQPRPGISLEHSAVLAYLSRYVGVADVQRVLKTSTRLQFQEYDWKLNSKE
ncbi:MAG: DUF547 domain-containing protein, partial [Myxococcota bacterium]